MTDIFMISYVPTLLLYMIYLFCGVLSQIVVSAFRGLRVNETASFAMGDPKTYSGW